MEKKVVDSGWQKDYYAAMNDDSEQIARVHLGYDGTKQKLTDQQFKECNEQEFTILCFEFADLFHEYRDSNIMKDKLAKLKANMDDISCDYIDRHERLVDFTRNQGQYLVRRDFVWTDEDKKRIQLYHARKEASNPPILKHVDLTWGTSIVNLYGLYDVPEQILNRVDGKAIIDAGGFIGDTITVFRERFKNSVVHSFEPVEKNFNYMTSLLNKDIKNGKVVPVKKALGAREEKLKITTLKRDDKLYANSSLLFDFEDGESVEEVDVITIDQYVKDNNLELGIIKMDVEGFEPQIVQGALETIKSQRPILAISCYHTPEEYYDLKPYLESLNLGYKFQMRHSTCIMPLGDLVIVAYPED